MFWTIGYLDAMGTSARLAEPHAKHRVPPGRLAEEQAALRRVATLVAGGAPSSEVFAAVAKEVAQVLHLPNAWVCRYDSDGTVMKMLAVVGARPDTFHPGTRWPLDGPSVAREILRTGRPAQVEDYADLPGTLAAEARESGLNRLAGAPIIVDGRVWGAIATSSPDAPLPEHARGSARGVHRAGGDSDRQQPGPRRAHPARRGAGGAAAGGDAGCGRRASGGGVRSGERGGRLPCFPRTPPLSRVTRQTAPSTALSGWTTEGGYDYVGRRYELEAPCRA